MKKIVRYLVVGGLTTVISLVVYYVCVTTFLNPQNSVQLQLANILSWVISVLFAYYANRRYVFESKNANILGEGLSFFASRISTLLMDMAIMFVSVTVCGMSDKIAKIISQVVVIVVNYVLSNSLVFGSKGEKK